LHSARPNAPVIHGRAPVVFDMRFSAPRSQRRDSVHSTGYGTTGTGHCMLGSMLNVVLTRPRPYCLERVPTEHMCEVAGVLFF